jgi:hypothetical protein
MENDTIEIKVEDKQPTLLPELYFTVSVATKQKKIMHVLVKASSAIDALVSVQDIEKAPVVAVHITEYTKYIDATEKTIVT